MKQYFRLILFILMSIVCNKTFAQTKQLTVAENRLVKLYSQLFWLGRTDMDDVELRSREFQTAFTDLVIKTPATLDYPFQKLSDSGFCRIETSEDKKFRIYSWDTWTGGTMHEFRTIYQWSDNGKVDAKPQSLDENDPGSFVSQIYAVNVTGKQYYLAITNAIYSSKDSRQSLQVFTINNGHLVDTVKLFKTKTKTLNRIDVDFDFFSVVNRPERPLKLITYDSKQQIVYIPVVDGTGKVSNKNIVYQLKGSGYFEFVGIENGKVNR